MSVRTPAKEDKRLWFSIANELAIVGLAIAGVVDGETAVQSMVAIAGLYMVQSQAGLVMRERAVKRRQPEEGDAD